MNQTQPCHRLNVLLLKTAVLAGLLSVLPVQAANYCNQVWHGVVERVRVQEQADGSLVTRIYIAPGTNAEYVGYTNRELLANNLINSKDTTAEVTGYTDANCKIQWVDFQ